MELYDAFDMRIYSDYQLGNIHAELSTQDLTIYSRSDIDSVPCDDRTKNLLTEFSICDTAAFCVWSDQIDVAEVPDANPNTINMYLTGICMAHILHHRGDLPLHGSCICKNGNTLLISGASGAGKSSLTTEMLNHNWMLMSDDLTAVRKEKGRFFAFPGSSDQKLWEDACERHELKIGPSDLVYEDKGRKKYRIDRREVFSETKVPLTTVVILDAAREHFDIKEISGFDKAALLIEHIYRRYILEDAPARSRAFQACIDLSKQIRMFVVSNPASKRIPEKTIAEKLETILYM